VLIQTKPLLWVPLSKEVFLKEVLLMSSY